MAGSAYFCTLFRPRMLLLNFKKADKYKVEIVKVVRLLLDSIFRFDKKFSEHFTYEKTLRGFIVAPQR